MKKFIAGAVAGAIMTISWTGTSDLMRIKHRAEEFSNQAVITINNLKQEVNAVNIDNETLIKEVQRLEKLTEGLSEEVDRAYAINGNMSEELQKANKETKQTADEVEKILDLDRLK